MHLKIEARFQILCIKREEELLFFGANGSGKSTVGHELARVLKYKYMDVEDYHFIKSEIPYTVEHSREDCLNLMLVDIEKYHSFVISAVTGDFGEKITSMYNLAILISAPLNIHIERIKQREYEQYGERIQKVVGILYEQHLKFIDFVVSRSISKI